MFKNKSIS